MYMCVLGGVFMIVVRMSERQQIVLLACEMGRYVFLGLGWDGGLKKERKKLFP